MERPDPHIAGADGIGVAATVRVGLAAGAGDAAGIRRAGYSAFFLTIAFMAICAVLMAAFARQIAGLFLSAAVEIRAVIAAAVPLLWIAASYQIVDGV